MEQRLIAEIIWLLLILQQRENERERERETDNNTVTRVVRIELSEIRAGYKMRATR